MPLAQEQIQRRGAAIECRVYAEDPVKFLPSPGTITSLRVPSGPGVRDDSGVLAGSVISVYYDPLISKLCTWAADRPAAIDRMRRALDEYHVGGIRTNLAFHRRVDAPPALPRAATTTPATSSGTRPTCSPPRPAPETVVDAAIAAALHASRSGPPTPLAAAGQRRHLRLAPGAAIPVSRRLHRCLTPPTSRPRLPPPELEPALAAFERGDFLAARRSIAQILAGNPGPELAAAARELAARLEIDPWAVRAGVIALALLALVTGIYVF